MTLVQTKISRFCVLAKIELFRDRCALEMGGLPVLNKNNLTENFQNMVKEAWNRYQAMQK